MVYTAVFCVVFLSELGHAFQPRRHAGRSDSRVRLESCLDHHLSELHGVPSSKSLVEVNQYGLVVLPDDASIEGYFLIRDSRALIANRVLDGEADDPSKALIVANVRDCQGRPVRGARFELVDDETGRVVLGERAVELFAGGTTHVRLFR